MMIVAVHLVNFVALHQGKWHRKGVGLEHRAGRNLKGVETWGRQATRAYLHKEADVEACLARLGWKVVKREMTATKFYFSRLLEAVPA